MIVKTTRVDDGLITVYAVGSIAEQGLCICRTSVRLSVCLSAIGHSIKHHSSKICCCGSAGRRYRSIAARRTAAGRAAGECGQCHVVSVRSGLTQICLSQRETRFLAILFCGRFLSFSDFRGFLFLQPVLLCTRQN